MLVQEEATSQLVQQLEESQSDHMQSMQRVLDNVNEELTAVKEQCTEHETSNSGLQSKLEVAQQEISRL